MSGYLGDIGSWLGGLFSGSPSYAGPPSGFDISQYPTYTPSYDPSTWTPTASQYEAFSQGANPASTSAVGGGKLEEALKGMKDIAKGEQPKPAPAAQAVEGQPGRPLRPVNLDELLNYLRSRTNMYLSATNPATQQTVPGMAETLKLRGLLGL